MIGDWKVKYLPRCTHHVFHVRRSSTSPEQYPKWAEPEGDVLDKDELTPLLYHARGGGAAG